MRKLLVLGLLCSALMMSGCMAAAASPVTGMFFTDVRGPFSVVDNDVKPEKVGVAECTSILGLIAQGDASISTAMKNGGITKVHHVDFESKSILGITASFKTTVYGE